MFKGIRQELRGLVVAIDHVAKALIVRSAEPLLVSTDESLGERVSALEGRIEAILGMVEAGVTKAEALKHTALAAESRAHGAQRRAEKLAAVEGGTEGAEEILEAYAKLGILPGGDATGVPDAEVSGVHPALEVLPGKTRALMMKFGG